MLWSSIYSSAPRYLNMNLDMRRAAYPQKSSSVWVSVEYISNLSKYVKQLFVTIDKKNYSGLGFVVSTSEPNTGKVLTINHVGNCDNLTMDGVKYCKPDIKKLSGAHDPIVSIEL